ncbi:MAG TPA: DUF2934 domain-containing protein [Polyangiales bacterium]|nr:DUF2934 domain-containing protein [Polyangiales bacterium]
MGKRKASVVVALHPEVPEALIAERAYFRWIARDRPISDGTEDWFAARAELETQMRPASRSGKRASA